MRSRLMGVGVPALMLAALGVSVALVKEERPGPAALRQQALERGLSPLFTATVPEPSNLADFVKDRRAAIALGKALFWDMGVSSGGMACASCHFHAGADGRVKNQLSPGSAGRDTAFGNNPATGGRDFAEFGPNMAATAKDFPFHRLSDLGNRSSEVLASTNDVFSSMGELQSGLTHPQQPAGPGTPVRDPVFHVGGVSVRRVEPRHAPSVINSVFNFASFWDGRAHNTFNGVSPFGPLDEGATLLVNHGGKLVERKVRLPDSSLASQAVGPPLSLFELSPSGRTFPVIGRKLIPLRPLRLQYVHPGDSVLGALSRARLGSGGRWRGSPGLHTTYGALIRRAFHDEYWSSTARIAIDARGNRNLSPPASTPVAERFTQMEANFSLFFGLAIQLYEATLVSDQTPYDRFLAGDDEALDAQQLKGLEVFYGRGACSGCHAGAALTLASVEATRRNGSILILPTLQLEGQHLVVNPVVTTYEDTGYFNIGVRPTEEDLGRGATDPWGAPLSVTRRALLKLADAPALPPCSSHCPQDNRSGAVDGAFKAPGLRNVELTGPYFHTGGYATLGQVVDFYRRQGDFTDSNIGSVSHGMGLIQLTAEDREPLVRFLLALTDERVRLEKAPFDHPQLFVPNGHPGTQDLLTCIDRREPLQACDDLLEVPAVGAGGRLAASLPPLQPFLSLPPLQ